MKNAGWLLLVVWCALVFGCGGRTILYTAAPIDPDAGAQPVPVRSADASPGRRSDDAGPQEADAGPQLAPADAGPQLAPADASLCARPAPGCACSVPGQMEPCSGESNACGASTMQCTQMGELAVWGVCSAPSCEPVATCPEDIPFTPIPWAPPTPLHQGLCTSAQTAAYATSMTAGSGPNTSGSATCDACIQTDEAVGAHGPIVTVKGVPTELNVGGCLADVTGAPSDAARGGCGNQLNNAIDCVSVECSDCSDVQNPTPTGATDTCQDTLFATAASGQGGASGVCAPGLSSACSTEVQMTEPMQMCMNFTTFATFLDLWCGP